MLETIMTAIIFLLAAAVIFLLIRGSKQRGAGIQAEIISLERSLAEMKERLEQQGAELAQEREKLSGETARRSAAEAKLEAALKNAEEQKKLLDEASARLTDTFKALSHDALRSNNQSFMDLAKKTMEAMAAEMRGDLGKKEEAISSLVKPLGDALKAYEEHVRALEMNRQKAYSGLYEQIKMLEESSSALRKETDNLVRALRKPQVRGKWGELTLRRTAELAGMVDRCDFYEQQTTTGTEERQRPDMIVKMPGGRTIVIDSKVPLDAYLDALEAGDEAGRQAALERHARQIKTHLKMLSAKEYWSQFEETPEFVVMFIPGETFLSAALEVDRGLMEEGFEKKVVIATPATLVALLKAVAYGWRQEQVAEHARVITETGKDLYTRLCTFCAHMDKMRGGLVKAMDSFNVAVGSLERMVLPSARRFRELGVTTREEIPLMEEIDHSGMRVLKQPEE